MILTTLNQNKKIGNIKFYKNNIFFFYKKNWKATLSVPIGTKSQKIKLKFLSLSKSLPKLKKLKQIFQSRKLIQFPKPKMSSQTETNTNNRTSDISDKKVGKESSKKIPQEAKSREQIENSVSTQNSLFKSRPELPNMSQSNEPTFSAVNNEKKIRKSKVSKPVIDATDVSLSQITKPVAPSNWDEATQDEKDTYKEHLNLWKQFNAKQKKAKQQQEPQPIQLEDDDEEEQPVQQEEVPVDASIEDELEQDQKQDDEERDQLVSTDQLTTSTMEVPVPFPHQKVEPLSAMDGVVKEYALKPMSSPPSQDAPLSAMDFEEPARSVQFQEEQEQETCMFCIGNLKDRKVSKCSFCSGHLCLGACRDTIINAGNNCPQCRKKYFRTEEEKFLDDMEAEEQERRRQFDLRRLEFLRKQKVQEEMNRSTEIRQQKLADVETRKQEMIQRHREEMNALLLEEQRLTCMTDTEIVALQVQAIPDASLITPERRSVIAPMRSTTPSRERGRSPARARASSPTPSNEGSRQGGRATAVQKDRSCAGCDIRVGDEIEFKLPKQEQTWRVRCLSANGTGSFQVLRSINSPEFVGRQYSTGKSPINSAFQDYCFSLGIAKQLKTPWAGHMYKYRGGVCLGKQK